MEIEHANGIIWEVTFWEFVLVTVILAGAAAYMTGRANARVWGDEITLVVYMVLLAAATRFIHFALFSGTLLSPWYYVVDLIVLLVIAFVGKRITRAGQMARQYGFEYERRNAFVWGRKG
jgi:GR25 family glycosyltransferase involved in LPS biosynthesis